jgi:hypothetical protein
MYEVHFYKKNISSDDLYENEYVVNNKDVVALYAVEVK